MRVRARGLPLHELPVGVLADDLAVPELEQVAAAHLDALAVRAGAGQEPLGAAAIAGEPVPGVAVADVGDAGEAARESLAHALAALQPSSPRILAPGHL